MVAISNDVRNRVLGLDANSRGLATRGFGIGGAENSADSRAGLGRHRAFGSPYTVELWDDFVDIDSGRWTSLLGSAPPGSPAIVAATANGVARLTAASSTGSMAADGVQMVGANRFWLANSGNLVFEARIKLAVITSLSCFFGFTDNLTLEAPITSAASSNTITTNATDAVGVMFDTSMSTANWWLVGVANDTDATAQNATVAPTAATYETWRIELSAAGVATFYRNGALIGTTMSGAVTPTVALTPTFSIFPRSAASGKILDVDYCHVSADRA